MNEYCYSEFYGDYASELIDNYEYIIDEFAVEADHPPITPVAWEEDLMWLEENSAEQKIFDLVMMNFFASISVDAQYNSVTTTFEVGGKIFKETHLEMVEEGFTKYIEADLMKPDKMKFVDYQFEEKSSFKIIKKEVMECQTAPKQYLSESELIEKMEKYRIGTDGTIPKHIKKIIDRKYVTVKEERNGIRRLVPTPRGEILAEGYLEIDEDLIKPSVRGFIEKCCSKISEHKKDSEVVTSQVIEIFRKKLVNLTNNIHKIKEYLILIKNN